MKNKILQTTGLQKKILDTAIDLCAANKKLETGPILTSGLASYINITVGSLKMSLNRLISKNFLQRGVGRSARGGYINLHVTQEIYNLVLQTREENKFFQNSINSIQIKNNFSISDLDNKLGNNSVYSSSNIINKTNTTEGKNKNLNLPDEWLAIDFSPLEHINFSKTQLHQLLDKNIPEVVQDSINHFAYDLEHGSKKYPDPLNVFMGVLRKGNAWTAPKGYESPKDIARRLYAEKIKKENEQREKTITDLIALEFDVWKANLGKEEINNIIPEKDQNFCKENTHPWNVALRLHFKNNILIPRLIKEGAY